MIHAEGKVQEVGLRQGSCSKAPEQNSKSPQSRPLELRQMESCIANEDACTQHCSAYVTHTFEMHEKVL